jgi:hypothetical protein
VEQTIKRIRRGKKQQSATMKSGKKHKNKKTEQQSSKKVQKEPKGKKVSLWTLL